MFSLLLIGHIKDDAVEEEEEHLNGSLLDFLNESWEEERWFFISLEEEPLVVDGIFTRLVILLLGFFTSFSGM